MRLIITPVIFKKYPKLIVGAVIAKGINNKGLQEKIYSLLDDMQELVKLNFIPSELSKHQMISPWRTAYSEFGTKPSKHHSSVEALIRQVLKGKKIPKVNKLVNIYNYLSLKHMLPMGADDLDKVEGNIWLMFADGAEIFVPLNSTEIEHPNPGEVIYKDERRVLCRKWNWRECDKTKITEETKNAIIYVEALPPIRKEKVKAACKELKELIEMFCGGTVEHHILDLAKGECEI